MELVPEASERSPSLQRVAQPPAGRAVADAFGEIGHVLVPDEGRERVDHDEVQLVDLDRVLAVDAGVAGPEQDFAGERIEQPSIVVSLVPQRGGDLLDVD